MNLSLLHFDIRSDPDSHFFSVGSGLVFFSQSDPDPWKKMSDPHPCPYFGPMQISWPKIRQEKKMKKGEGKITGLNALTSRLF